MHRSNVSLLRLQGVLCGVLQVIIQRLTEDQAMRSFVVQFADKIMQTMLQVFQCRNVTVHEEAMLAVGALTYASGKQFVTYMPSFFPVLLQGLASHQVGLHLADCQPAAAECVKLAYRPMMGPAHAVKQTYQCMAAYRLAAVVSNCVPITAQISLVSLPIRKVTHSS